jgi:hypothetical protein
MIWDWAGREAGGDDPVQHALAEQQDHAKADPVDRLGGQDHQQLVPPGGPDEPDRALARGEDAPPTVA